MKRYLAIILILLLSSAAAACGSDAKGRENGTIQNVEASDTDSSLKEEHEPEPKAVTESGTGAESESGAWLETELDNRKGTEEDGVEANQIYINVGENTLTAVLEDNESAEALKELLADGPLTIPASNYGGFEKVCPLGTELPRNDSQTTTRAGDICLYSGSQIVLFYGSNSWAYTRLGKVSDADASELEEILSGEETEITLSLEAFR